MPVLPRIAASVSLTIYSVLLLFFPGIPYCVITFTPETLCRILRLGRVVLDPFYPVFLSRLKIIKHPNSLSAFACRRLSNKLLDKTIRVINAGLLL